jgi:preprotein translocase subunit YajC
MEIVVLYLALLAGAFFFFIVRPQRRQIAARRVLIASLEVGDEIITAGGIHGTVREIDDTTMKVEVAPGTVLTLAREAVSSRSVPPTETDPAVEAPADASPDPTDGRELGESR